MGNRRAEFSPATKRRERAAAGGQCRRCPKLLGPTEGEFNHIAEEWLTHDRSQENCELLCHDCHKAETARQAAERGRVLRLRRRWVDGEKRQPRRPVPGSRCTAYRKPLNGPAVRRQTTGGRRGEEPPAET